MTVNQRVAGSSPAGGATNPARDGGVFCLYSVGLESKSLVVSLVRLGCKLENSRLNMGLTFRFEIDLKLYSLVLYQFLIILKFK